MSLKVKIPQIGRKNLTIQVAGRVEPGDDSIQQLFSIAGLASPEMSGLRIDSVLFALQEKAGLLLWWDRDGADLILPLESRGAFSFSYPIHSPKGWDGMMYYSTFKVDEPKHLYLTLECEPL